MYEVNDKGECLECGCVVSKWDEMEDRIKELETALRDLIDRVETWPDPLASEAYLRAKAVLDK